jgi:hypothetical protein
MTRFPLACVTLVALLLAAQRIGYAQVGEYPGLQGSFSGGAAPTRSPAPATGYAISDGVMLHMGVGAEGGFDNNVFYNDTQKASAGVLRVTPFLELTNTGRSGQAPSGLFFDARAALTYREYFSNDEDIKRLRAFMPLVNAVLEHNSRGTLVLAVTENYVRLEDAPYSRGTGPGTEVIVRDNNVASAQLRWAPGGGRLQGVLRYTNTWDRFDTPSLQGASSLGHEGMLDVSWRWLPKTALFFQARQGYIYYYNDDTTGGLTGTPGRKPSSYPLRLLLGIRGLVTEKTAVTLQAGYHNSFYSSGPNTSGLLGSITVGAELTVTPTFNSRIIVGYRRDFQNSVIGNFYYNDSVYASAAHQTTFRLNSQLFGRYEHRKFEGVAGAGTEPRIDDFVQVGAMLDYFVKSWAYAGVSYALQMNRSDFAPVGGGMLGGVDYTKHQVFARLGFTY